MFLLDFVVCAAVRNRPAVAMFFLMAEFARSPRPPTLRNTTNCARVLLTLWSLEQVGARRQPCGAINLAQRNISATQHD